MLTTYLDAIGLTLIAAFAWFVWAPLPLLVVGLALCAASWRASR